MISHRRWVAASLIAAMILPRPVRADDRARLEAEGIAVLRVAAGLGDHTARVSSPCRIAAEWSRETVPYAIARGVFGVGVRADLAPRSPVPDSCDILSAVEQDPDRLCSSDEIVRQREAARAALPRGAEFSHHVASYTFPVFDSALTRAVVIWRALYVDRRLGEDGAKPGGVGVTDTAIVFAKRRTGWVLVAREVVGQT